MDTRKGSPSLHIGCRSFRYKVVLTQMVLMQIEVILLQKETQGNIPLFFVFVFAICSVISCSLSTEMFHVYDSDRKNCITQFSRGQITSNFIELYNTDIHCWS